MDEAGFARAGFGVGFVGSTGFASSDSFATLEDIRSRGVRVAEPLEVFDAALRSAVRIGSASFLVGRRVGSGGGARHLCCK